MIKLNNKRIKLLFLIFVASLMASSQVVAIAETPMYRFKIAEKKIKLQLGKVQKINTLVNIISSIVYTREYTFLGKNIIIVRITGTYCIEYCLTAFFLNVISDQSFLGMQMLPAKIGLGDGYWRFCAKCDRMTPIVFQDNRGKRVAVIISRGAIFFDQPLRQKGTYRRR